MIAVKLAVVPFTVDRQLRRLMIAAILLPVLLTLVPPVVREGPLLPLTYPERAPQVQTAPPPPSAVATTAQLPPEVRPVLNATLAANSGADYTVTPLAAPETGLRAGNPAHRFTTTFGTDSVQITPAHGPPVEMRATTMTTERGSVALPALRPMVTDGRVEYRREGLTEWYVNGPRGLEQGFTIAAPPSGAAAFTLRMTVTGATPIPEGVGVLRIGGLRYGDLAVIDAAGVTLPARLDVADGAIRIIVDATGATWPVTVDPTFTQTTLTPTTPPGNTVGAFGFRSAIAAANGTTTVVVGAPSELIGNQDEQGAVYVFTGSGNTYTQRARLVASDGTRQKRFGNSVAVVMNGGMTTIVVGANNASKAYVFTGSGATYTEQATLVPPDPSNNDDFGYSVAAALNGGTTIIAVGADIHKVGANNSQGSVYLFAGSGASYPLQVELNDPNGNIAESFGVSIALVSNGGTNTLAVGAPSRAVNGVYTQGTVLVFTGSGMSYTSVVLTASDGHSGESLGCSVALGVQGGITTVAAGGAGGNYNIQQDGAVYVFTGSGTAYTQIKLTDANGVFGDQFNRSVAVGFASPIGPTLIAVGAPVKSLHTNNPADGVVFFACARGVCTQSSVPETNGTVGDGYGNSLAMLTAANGDMTLAAGVPGTSGTGTVALSFANEAPSLSSITPILGNNSETIASPANTFSGAPFHLAARAVDQFGLPLSSTGITFTVRPSGATTGRFTASDPNSTTVHVTTHNGTGGTVAGQTDVINLFPSSTSGDFTVTALADGTTFSTIYTLTIIPKAPKPTINPVIPVGTSSAGTNTVRQNVVHGQPAGLSPAIVIIDPNVNYEIVITGTGFQSQSRGTLALFQPPVGNAIAMDVVYQSATQILVYLSGPQGAFNGITNDATGHIYVVNPESSPGAGDGGFSDPVAIQLVKSHPAPSGSTMTPSGATTIIVPPDTLVVPAPIQVIDSSGNPIANAVTGSGPGFVGIQGGELVAAGGGNLIGSDSAGLIGSDSAGIFGSNSAGVISNDGGSIIVSNSAGKAPPALSSGSAPHRTDAAHPITGTYIASTDANSIIMAPPVLSNGIPGTYTHTIAVDGIAQPVTYTITNLNPNDGHPTTITSLSRTTAYSTDPAFTLTVTGTGFVSGSVLSFGGVQLATTVISATQVSAVVPANLLKYSGALGVMVINPDPYGGASLPATFTVNVYVNPLPPAKPPGGPAPGTNPLPPARPADGPTGQAPNPLPPSR